MRPGRPRGFERREALDAALKVFWERGFEETSIADLERCLGVGRQSLYNAIGDKRCVFVAALQRYAEQYLQPQIEALLGASSPTEGLRLWLDGWLTATCEHSPGCLVANTMASPAASDPEIRAAIEGQVARLKDALEQTLRKAQQDLKRPPVLDAKTVAEALVALQVGRSLQGRVIAPDIEALRRAAEHLIASAL